MRQLEPYETARPGDWFYGFGGLGWYRLTAPTMLLYRMTIQEVEDGNKSPIGHFPIIIARPNVIERIFGIAPNWKPNQRKIRKARGTHAKS